MGAIWGRGYESLGIIGSCKGNEASDDSKGGYHHYEGAQRTTGRFISYDISRQVIYVRRAQPGWSKGYTSVSLSACVNIICWR